MSDHTFVVYFGIKFEIDPDEIKDIEDRSDPRIVSARKSGLNYYWGNFGGLEENYLLYIGYQIGILGVENYQEIILPLQEIESYFDVTQKKLVKAGFSESPSVHLHLQLDI